jgi:RNA polymerase sigma factor (sigma-70 family)
VRVLKRQKQRGDVFLEIEMYGMTDPLYAMAAIGSIFEPLHEMMLAHNPMYRLQVAVDRAKAEMPDWMHEQIFGERSYVAYLIPPRDVPRLPKLLGLAFATAYEITGDGHDAIEAVAEALLKVARHPTTPRNFDAYFLSAVRHAALDRVRHRRYRRRHEFLDADGAFDALKNSFELHDIALAMDVRSAVNGMESPYRDVADLHYLQGYTRPEIAVEMGESLSTINNWVHEARCQLRVTLADYSTRGAASRRSTLHEEKIQRGQQWGEVPRHLTRVGGS